MKRNTCRLCGSQNVEMFLSLGSMPRAGEYLKKEELTKIVKNYPLEVYFCKHCFSVQLFDIIPRDVLFEDYRYLSSVASKSVLEHFDNYAKEINQNFIKKDSFLVEIACNDGILLKPIKDLGISCIGVDPATNIIQIGKNKGLEIINDFFGLETAQKIINSKGQADVIVANAVFAHVDDMDDLTQGIKILLKPSGVFIFEVHHLADIIETLQYDSIYHEHFSYHSVLSLSKFLKKYGMEIFDIKKFSIRGGMIRVYARKIDYFHQDKISDSVNDFIKKELDMKLDKFETFEKFGKDVNNHKKLMLDTLHKFKKQGKKIVAYGMSGRGNTLLNYWNVGTNIIDYGIDASPERYNRYVPGVHIPIIPPENSLNGVDIALLLAWIFADDILKKEKSFTERGGKFLIPLPHPMLKP